MTTHDLQEALRQAKDAPWVVLLCPDLTTTEEARKLLGLFTPVGVPFSGRTSVFPHQKVTVASAREDVFLPQDSSFTVVLLAWGSTPMKEAERWLKK